MIHVFIDLEFCTCFRKSSPLRTETIEIGAVKIDEDFKVIGEFDSLVRPDFATTIPSTERNLTGITWAMVENERSFSDVMEEFMNWVGTGDFTIYSWSNNDAMQVLRESRVKGFPAADIGLFKKWVDFQQVFMAAVGMKNQISLERAIELADIYFVGEAHRAVVDSYNTARLFIYCKSLETVSMNITSLDVNGSFTGNAAETRRRRRGGSRPARNGRRNIGSGNSEKQERENTAHLAAGVKPKRENPDGTAPEAGQEKAKKTPPRRRGRAHRGGRKKKNVV